jgi:alpha-L-fucosidase 2
MTFDDGTRVEVLVHATEPVGMARIVGSHAPEVKLKARAFHGSPTGATGDQQTGSALELLGYPAPVETSGAGWRAFTQTGAEGFHFAVYVAWQDAKSVRTLAWSIASSTEGAGPLLLARRRVEAALGDGFAKVSASHRQWWSRFWAQSTDR